jgi:hypothetical protein
VASSARIIARKAARQGTAFSDLSIERADRNDETQDEGKVVQEIAKSVRLKLDGRWYEPDSAICISHLNVHTGSPPTF